jgi:hypothetical protein
VKENEDVVALYRRTFKKDKKDYFYPECEK